MAVPLIISPCATLAVLPPQELTTQQMVSKVLLYSGLNGSMRAWATQRFYSEVPPLKTTVVLQILGIQIKARENVHCPERGRDRREHHQLGYLCQPHITCQVEAKGG